MADYGPPCIHAAAVIFNKLRGAYQYVDHYYHTSYYIQSYADPIIQLVQPIYDPNGNLIAPPDYQPKRECQSAREYNIGGKDYQEDHMQSMRR